MPFSVLEMFLSHKTVKLNLTCKEQGLIISLNSIMEMYCKSKQQSLVGAFQ
jgi:hypothetical protein